MGPWDALLDKIVIYYDSFSDPQKVLCLQFLLQNGDDVELGGTCDSSNTNKYE